MSLLYIYADCIFLMRKIILKFSHSLKLSNLNKVLICIQIFALVMKKLVKIVRKKYEY
jgi:hypothetical protein